MAWLCGRIPASHSKPRAGLTWLIKYPPSIVAIRTKLVGCAKTVGCLLQIALVSYAVLVTYHCKPPERDISSSFVCHSARQSYSMNILPFGWSNFSGCLLLHPYSSHFPQNINTVTIDSCIEAVLSLVFTSNSIIAMAATLTPLNPVLIRDMPNLYNASTEKLFGSS